MGAAVVGVEADAFEVEADIEVVVESRTLKGRVDSERIRKAAAGMDWEALLMVGRKEASTVKAMQSTRWDSSQKVLCCASGLAKYFCRSNGQYD